MVELRSVSNLAPDTVGASNFSQFLYKTWGYNQHLFHYNKQLLLPKLKQICE